jgi:hypothetical protein
MLDNMKYFLRIRIDRISLPDRENWTIYWKLQELAITTAKWLLPDRLMETIGTGYHHS